jgi:hypothetical protein
MTDSSILDLLKQYLPFLGNLDMILFGLGLLVLLISLIDYIIPDSTDHHFSAKILNVPVLGKVCKFLLRFSLRRAGLSVNNDSILNDAVTDETKPENK